MDVYLVYVKLGPAYVLPTLNIWEVCTGGGMRGRGEGKGYSSTPVGRAWHSLSMREEEAHGENSTERKKSLTTEVVHKGRLRVRPSRLQYKIKNQQQWHLCKWIT